jgi:hypothetical protein
MHQLFHNHCVGFLGFFSSNGKTNSQNIVKNKESSSSIQGKILAIEKVKQKPTLCKHINILYTIAYIIDYSFG